MPPEPRQTVADLPPAVHGALDFGELRRLGIDPDEVLDFSANTNPFDPAPAVRAALANVPLDRYPDREALAFRSAAAEVLGVPVGRILAGNGASELIWLTALAYIRPRDGVLIVGPAYSEYARAAAMMGGEVTTWRAREEDQFEPDPPAIAAEVERRRPRAVFVCNPNNPTGAAFDPDALTALAARHPKTLFVIDEAYLPFALGLRSVLTTPADNVLVLRSLTKDCGLAGLRLGYAVGPEPVIEALRRVQPPWSVNAFAQAAGVVILQDGRRGMPSLSRLVQAQADLRAGLTALGLRPLPSAAPFFLVRVGDGAGFRRSLLALRILVRDCASFGLPEYVRICTRRPEENERLLAAVREML
jgi:histidinol-phosphate aminotransferase